jgi:transposase
MKVTRIGIDLAKSVFQVFGVDERERKVVSRQIKRAQLLAFFQSLEACLIGMEACSSAHFWAHQLQRMGHTVRLIAPQFVKPYVKGNKNDANDAEAICEALGRPNMRFVPIKTVEQLNMQALHRVRSLSVRQRTAKVNEIRGLLSEYGIVVSRGVSKLRGQLPLILEDADNGLTGEFRWLLRALQEDLTHLDERIKLMDQRMALLASDNAQAKKLLELRGVGPTTATALLAALGDGRQFRRGRCASAWVGIVPGQHSSGGKERLLGISKRGDPYLRTLLIHGARSVVNSCKDKTDPLSVWVQELCRRRNKNIAAVALANKTMRLAWVILSQDTRYDPNHKRTKAAAAG